jgi:hypothetical protein
LICKQNIVFVTNSLITRRGDTEHSKFAFLVDSLPVEAKFANTPSAADNFFVFIAMPFRSVENRSMSPMHATVEVILLRLQKVRNILWHSSRHV